MKNYLWVQELPSKSPANAQITWMGLWLNEINSRSAFDFFVRNQLLLKDVVLALFCVGFYVISVLLWYKKENFPK